MPSLLLWRAGRSRRTRLAGRIAEVAEELRIGPQQHARIVMLHASLVGLHRAVEREEVRILAERLGKDSVAFGVALAADLLGLRGRLRDQFGHLAIGGSLDFRRALLPL